MRFSRSEAEAFIRPYASDLREAIVGAWGTFHAIPIGYRLALGPSSRATCVHDYIELGIRERFSAVQDTSSFIRNQLFILSLKGRVLVRFKKLDEDWRSSGIWTQQNLRFLNQADLAGTMPQAEQLNLLTLPEPAHWEAGYQVSEVGALSGIYLTQPAGLDDPDWVIDLDRLGAAGSGGPAPAPAGPSGGPTPLGGPPPVRVTPKVPKVPAKKTVS